MDRSPARTGRTFRSCLYMGRVMHRRLGAVSHKFTYRVFSLLVDLDELPALSGRLKLFSHNRFNLLAFLDRDHGPRDGRPLRPWIDKVLADAGLDLAGGRVRILCFPRLLGYVFNPLSIWFCHHRNGRLAAVLYEVKNTFGEQHCYLIPVDPNHEPGAPLHQHCDKCFYVSPFIEMQATYRFRLTEPDERFALVIRQSTREGEILVATQTARREQLSDGALLRALAGNPAMTGKVIAGIHWEAFRLWRKGARYSGRPRPPALPVTAVATTTGPQLPTAAE